MANKNNAETRLFRAMSDEQKIAFLRLCEAVFDWQKHMVGEAGGQIARSLAKLPTEVAVAVQPTLRKLYQSYRGDSVFRLKQQGDVWTLPDYRIAGFGNLNAAKFFGRISELSSSGRFIVSGRDLISVKAAVDTEGLYRFIDKATYALDEFSDLYDGQEWAYAHQAVGDDESEIITVEPRFRPFTNQEKGKGHSKNARIAFPSRVAARFLLGQ